MSLVPHVPKVNMSPSNLLFSYLEPLYCSSFVHGNVGTLVLNTLKGIILKSFNNTKYFGNNVGMHVLEFIIPTALEKVTTL